MTARKRPLTAPQLLLRAAKRLEKRGWTRYSLGLKEGPNCAMGAIMHEAGALDSQAKGEAYRRLRKVIKSESIGAWNDDYARTKRQVVSALRKAAKLPEERS